MFVGEFSTAPVGATIGRAAGKRFGFTDMFGEFVASYPADVQCAPLHSDWNRTGNPKERASEEARSIFYYTLPTKALYRKVTIWPLTQSSWGLKVFCAVPLVTPRSTAQRTASQ